MKQLLLLISMCFLACNSTVPSNQNIITYNWDDKTTNLTSQSQVCDSLLLGSIVYNIYNDYLFFMNDRRKNDKHISCFLTKGDSILYKGGILNFGNGPMEAVMSDISFLKNDNKIIFANSGGSATVVNYYELPLQPIDSIYNHSALTYKKALKGNSIVKSLAISDSSFLVMQAIDSNVMFGYYENGGNRVTCLDFPYPDNGRGYSNLLKSQVYTGFLSKNPTKTQFLYSSQYGNYVIIFELNNGIIDNVIELYNAHPDYTSSDGYNFKMAKFVYGMVPFVTQDYVYLKPMQGNDGSWYSNELYVFDWTGKQVRKIITDKPYGSFVVDSNDKSMYASSIDLEKGNEVIIKIKLD